jgi:hypothetical protein
LTDGQFFGHVLLRELERYKRVFGCARTHFVFWADMILPFGEGYHYIAERNNDQDALDFIAKKLAPVYSVLPAVWIYDYSRSWTDPHRFMLGNEDEVKISLDRIVGHGLPFVVSYATDGKLADLSGVDPAVRNDTAHVRHEIAMARAWNDLTQSPRYRTKSAGCMVTGWTGVLRMNGWDGLFPMAYFGWWNPTARRLPQAWNAISATPDVHGQPVLTVLDSTRLIGEPARRGR